MVGWQTCEVWCGGGGLVDKFWVRQKIVYGKLNIKPIFVTSAFILQSIGKQFLIDQQFLSPQTLVNAENIFQKSISIKPNTALHLNL